MTIPSVVAHDIAPVTASNRPFLAHVSYRADDYTSLRAQLLAHIAEAFPHWNTRLVGATGDEDLAVAFAELFAYMSDILGFYQDCRANESYIRTATLAQSLIDLTALIDYRVPPGASAETLQAFFVKEGLAGTVPQAYRVQSKASGANPALTFETSRAIDVASTRNALHIAGWNRSSRVINATGVQRLSQLTLDQGYSGLRAGSFVVFQAGSHEYSVPLSAVTTSGDLRVIHWAELELPADIDLPVADTIILGKPTQVMRVAASERADELTAGANAAMVASSTGMQNEDVILIVADGVKWPAHIIGVTGNRVSWDRPINVSVRRSAASVYNAGHTGIGSSYASRFGATALTYVYNSNPQPTAGDYLILATNDGIEVVLIISVSGRDIVVGQPLSRAYPNGAKLYSVRIADPSVGITGSAHTSFAPLRLDATSQTLVLDRSYDKLEAGSVLVITDGVDRVVHHVTSVAIDDQERSVVALALPLAREFRAAFTTVHGPLELRMQVAGYDRAEGSLPAGQGALTLVGQVPGLFPGSYIVIDGGAFAEGARITAVQSSGGDTSITLREKLEHEYPLADTVVYANVVLASHGASQPLQVLGSGDGSQANQTFVLRRAPVSFVHDASGIRGVRNTLEVFVDDARWTEVESLAEGAPDDRHYMTTLDEAGVMTVRFGDGNHGARLPSGVDNVRARFRVGLGANGNLAQGAIDQAPEPLSFVDSTRNAVSASGGADTDSRAITKRIAPITVRALDRAVSLDDYADLALSYAGIAKARATWRAWSRGRRAIDLTVAGVGGAPLTPSLLASVRAFLEQRRAPMHRLNIRDYRSYPVRVALTIGVLSDHLRMETLVRVRQALGTGIAADGTLGFFHFDRRELGEGLALSDLYATVEAVPGVDFAVASDFRGEQSSASAGTVLDRVVVPDDAVATGGDPMDASIGILDVTVQGGIV